MRQQGALAMVIFYSNKINAFLGGDMISSVLMISRADDLFEEDCQ